MPPKGPTPKPRSRTLVLLVSCGLWLLYFDLLTSMPGCASSDDTAKIEAVDAGPTPSSSTDAPSGGADGNVAPGIDAANPTIDGAPDDTGTGDTGTIVDGAGIDGALDAGAIVDGASIDGAPVDGAIIDSGFIIDAPILIDSGLLIDSGFFVDAAPDA